MKQRRKKKIKTSIQSFIPKLKGVMTLSQTKTGYNHGFKYQLNMIYFGNIVSGLEVPGTINPIILADIKADNDDMDNVTDSNDWY